MIRISRQLLIAGAVVASAVSCLDAQSSGGDFGSTTATQSNSPAQVRTGFNALPFRAANRPSNSPVTNQAQINPPIRLVSPKPSGRSRVPNQFSPSPMNGSKPFTASNSGEPGSAKINRVGATKTSFGNPPNNDPTQSSSQESLRDLPSHIDLDRCLVSFIDDISLPAKESGVIKSLNVKEGDYVPAGTVVGKIDDELYQLMLDQAQLRFELATEAANDTFPITAAEKKLLVATVEAKKTSGLADKGSKSETDRLMANYTKDIAALELQMAKRDKQKAVGEQRLEAARLMEVRTHMKGHILQSDFDAYVIKILKKPQEYVQQGEEVMRIARMDRLWVQGTIDIADLNPDEVINRKVEVTVTRARGEQKKIDGVITNIGLESQSGTRYMVKAEVKNEPVGKHWILQPLSTVKMRILLDNSPSQTGTFGSASFPK